MNILLVWDGDYPWDIRVDKMCSSLIRYDHAIHIACRNLAGRPLKDTYNGAAIHRLPALPRSMSQLNAAISFPAFFSPLWLWHLYLIGKKQQCQLIIVRDLPMALGAIWVANWLRVPCILDMAECYPEMLRCTWKFEGRSFKNYFLRNPRLADLVEQEVMRRIDEIWVMVEESRNRLISMSVPPDKIKIISNTPVVSRFTNISTIKKTDSVYRLFYVGLLNFPRGLDTAIRAVAKYVRKNPDFQFILVGKGRAEKHLQQLATELGVEKWVKFLGWMDNTEIPRQIAFSDVGIVPHYKCSHWDNTIPNKLFDYMAASKPVIVSNTIPTARIVEETGCGLVYQDRDIDALVMALERLGMPEVRRELGKKGQQAVFEKYNWEKEEKILHQAIAQYANSLEEKGCMMRG